MVLVYHKRYTVLMKQKVTKSRASVPGPNMAIVSLCLRLGLAFTFAYAAIDAFREPNVWIGFVPSFSARFIDPKLALDLLSLSQLVLVAALLFKLYVKIAALASIAFLLGLTIFNFASFLITFRDIGLALAAAALFYTE